MHYLFLITPEKGIFSTPHFGTGRTSAIGPSRAHSLFRCRGLAGFPLMPFFERDLKWSYLEMAGTWAYSSFASHVFIASSTARVKSPFFPLNLSIVLNLSCFSSSSGSSTHIRPIFLFTDFYYRFFVHVSTC